MSFIIQKTALNQKRLLLVGLLALVLIMLFASGCEEEIQQKSVIIPEDETIAVVNNKKITLSKFQKRFNLYLNRYKNTIIQEEQHLKDLKEIVINQLIKEELIAQEASRKGVEVSDEELETLAAESFSPYQGANFEFFLDDVDVQKEQWVNQLKNIILEKKLLQKELISRIPISKKEIRDYYKKNRKQFIIPRAYRVQNIAVATKDEAEAIKLQLKRGKSFTELVRNHSISPDRIVDGDLGFVERGELPPDMEKEIFKLHYANRYSNIVLSQDGFHLFYLKEYRPKQTLSIQQARSRIKEILIQTKQDEAYRKWIDQLVANASISIDQNLLLSEEGF